MNFVVIVVVFVVVVRGFVVTRVVVEVAVVAVVVEVGSSSSSCATDCVSSGVLSGEIHVGEVVESEVAAVRGSGGSARSRDTCVAVTCVVRTAVRCRDNLTRRRFRSKDTVAVGALRRGFGAVSRIT